MKTAQRRRTGWAIAASLAAHLAVGVVILLQRTSLPVPSDLGGPPEAIIPILILPKTPPATAGRKAEVQPIRLHRRPQPFVPPDVTPAPIAPPTPPAAPAARSAPAALPALHPAPQPEGPKGDVRTALRGSYVGCANAQAVGLNRAEQDACDEKFGKGAKDALFVGLGLSPDKQRLLDATGARKESDYRYKHSQAPAIGQTAGGGDHAWGNPAQAGIGETAETMGKALGNDRPKLTVPY
ncbi:hypothetical protein [Phenylobacterium sp.]|uniref:hypothetical protein n=1 Tax=Phenylobacterium sp. TaxID=1871053 RepID=UPI0025EC5995|nr:hypothetical protein [Phenylobacterium sp.]